MQYDHGDAQLNDELSAMERDPYFSRKRIAITACATVALLLVATLAAYAVYVGIAEGQYIRLAQAAVPLGFSAIGLKVFAGYWVACYRQVQHPRDRGG